MLFDLHRCVASPCNGGTEFLRVGVSWLDLNPALCQVDLNLGTLVDGPNRLGYGAGAVATGHVAYFKANHCYALMVDFDETECEASHDGNVKAPATYPLTFPHWQG